MVANTIQNSKFAFRYKIKNVDSKNNNSDFDRCRGRFFLDFGTEWKFVDSKIQISAIAAAEFRILIVGIR